ncbi:MAG: PBP1A family penicillin-binding protein [Clostridiales bacterium]|nr:PBP1A family penicillin-binding protein [Clostridiales bacterium]
MANNWDLEKHAKRTNTNSKKTKKKKKKGCSIIFIVFLGAVLAGVGAAVGGLLGLLETSSDINLDEYLSGNSMATVFYDVNGEKVASVHGGENRLSVSLNQIPYYFQKAFISIEDERFYEHKGIDYKRTAGAIFKYVTTLGKGSYGGSTITQQLVKNITDDRDKSPLRKIREWWRATLLERELSKDQILELYMNTIFFGNGAYGVQTAAYTYFDKDVSELSLAECAMLAGITNRPTYYNPFKNFDNAKSRQETILNKMLELGYIDEATCESAKKEEITLKKGSLNSSSEQSYFVDMVIEDVIEDLMEKENVTRAMASNMIYNGGLKIYTTMEPKVQEAIEKVYVDQDAETFSAFKKLEEQPESAMVVIDYKKGYISGVVGGRGEKTDSRGLNRATQSFRQPGSTIKPLAIYGPALEDDKITAATILSDTPITVEIKGSDDWSPSNWYGYYEGDVTVRRAIERSMNIPPVRVLQKIGLDRAYQALLDLGITSLKTMDKNYAPLSLGGLTDGVSVREWTAAYGMIANDGEYITPISYTKVVDSKGQTILNNKTKATRIMSRQSAFIMKDMLRTVVTNGTATSAKLSGMTAAGKTGSTSDTKDKWFVGFTPYYVSAVWVGYDTPKELTVGGEISKQIWKKVMTEVHKGLEDVGFVQPDGVSKITVCKKSGRKNTVNCTSVTTEYFKTSTIPTGYCTVCKSQVLVPEPEVVE